MEEPGTELRLADSAFQPIVAVGIDKAHYVWESGGGGGGGGLRVKKGAANPVRFAEKATFAGAAALPKSGAVIVWQSEATGAKSLLADRLD